MKHVQRLVTIFFKGSQLNYHLSIMSGKVHSKLLTNYYWQCSGLRVGNRGLFFSVLLEIFLMSICLHEYVIFY